MTALDELTTVVLAPNPGPMTLEGTNTYVLSRSGSGSALVIDPGPDVPAHRAAVEAALHQIDAEPAGVVLTHHHADHAEAAGWATSWEAPLWAFAPALVPGHARALRDGGRIAGGGVALETVHTPGHTADSVCLRVLGTGAVLTGDHLLGRGTTVIAHPDGSMTAYLRSLRRLAALDAAVLFPGHGPALTDPAGVLAAHLAHRLAREGQVLAAVRGGARTAGVIVAALYADVDPALLGAAERSVRAHLSKLVDDGLIAADGDAFAATA